MDVSAVFEQLAAAVRESGALALAKRGTVENIGKDEVGEAGDTERLTAMRRAKTVIDEQVQEILLEHAEKHLGTDIVVDAEEDTPMLAHFPATNAARSLVIDPIDGTLEYLEGTDSYSVCLALLERGSVLFSLVFFPSRDITYALTPDGKPVAYTSFSTLGTAQSTEVEIAPSSSRLLYKTRRLSAEMEKKFLDAGFEVREFDNYAEGLLAVLDGRAVGCIACEPQVRDILIGPVIGAARGGFSCDFRGEAIQWPTRGRLSEGFFGNACIEKEIRAILSQ